MQRKARNLPAQLRRHAHVGHDGRVHARLQRLARRIHEVRKLAVRGKGVDRGVEALALRVAQAHGLPERLRVEVAREGAQAVPRKPAVHRVRAEAQRGLQLLHAPRGGEQLHPLHGHMPRSSSYAFHSGA